MRIASLRGTARRAVAALTPAPYVPVLAPAAAAREILLRSSQSENRAGVDPPSAQVPPNGASPVGRPGAIPSPHDRAATAASAAPAVGDCGAWGQRVWPFAAVGAGALSLVLGLTKLTKYPWWEDEEVTYRTATSSFSGIWHAARTTEQPHLVYYLLMKGWFAISGGGQSHWLDRFPSVVFMALAVTTLTMLGTRLFGRTAGFVGGLTLATNFYLLHWQQFARSMTLTLFLAVFATYAFVRALEAPASPTWARAWALALVAASWVNLFGVCVLGAHAVAYLVYTHFHPHEPRVRRRELPLALATVVLIIPNVVLVATADNRQLDWIPPVSFRHVLVQSWTWAGRNPVSLAGGALGFAALAARAVSAARGPTSTLAGRWRVDPWTVALLLAWLASPFVVTLLLSAIRPAFHAHYLFPATPALALLVGVAVTSLPRRLGLALLALMIVSAGLEVVRYYAAPPYGSLSSIF